MNVIESVRSLLNGLVVVPGQDALSLEAQLEARPTSVVTPVAKVRPAAVQPTEVDATQKGE